MEPETHGSIKFSKHITSIGRLQTVGTKISSFNFLLGYMETILPSPEVRQSWTIRGEQMCCDQRPCLHQSLAFSVLFCLLFSYLLRPFVEVSMDPLAWIPEPRKVNYLLLSSETEIPMTIPDGHRGDYTK